MSFVYLWNVWVLSVGNMRVKCLETDRSSSSLTSRRTSQVTRSARRCKGAKFSIRLGRCCPYLLGWRPSNPPSPRRPGGPPQTSPASSYPRASGTCCSSICTRLLRSKCECCALRLAYRNVEIWNWTTSVKFPCKPSARRPSRRPRSTQRMPPMNTFCWRASCWWQCTR